MKTIFITGADGMLGVDLVRRLRSHHHRVIASTIRSMDITDLAAVKRTLFSIHPDVVIHTAAYTAVDRAESEREKCIILNAEGTKNIAFFCREIGAELIYISTDYVFDGTKKSPYIETDKPCPINVYGESKRRGEIAVQTLCERHKICRTSWLIGLYGISGANFLETIFCAADAKQKLRIVSDQLGRPTFTFDLAAMLETMLLLSEYGIFHITNSGECSWYEFAKTALEMSGRADVRVQAIPSSEYKQAAPRPINSRLDAPRLKHLGIPPLRHWCDALKEYIRRRKRAKKISY